MKSFLPVMIVALTAAGALFSGCRTETNLTSQEQVDAAVEAAQKSAAAAASKLKAKGVWPPKDFAKVVAYRFKRPDAESKNGPEDPITIIRDSKVDMALLEKAAVKTVDLTAAQTEKLMESAFSKSKISVPAACYDPHHLFLFYDKDGGLTNALEVCFKCTSVSTLPELDESLWKRHDFRGLARLCDEAGLWTEGNSIKEYFQLLDARGEP